MIVVDAAFRFVVVSAVVVLKATTAGFFHVDDIDDFRRTSVVILIC